MKYRVSFTISVPLQYTAYLKIISWLYIWKESQALDSYRWNWSFTTRGV